MTQTINQEATLAGKVFVITGGTQGLGAATARLFAALGAGGLVLCGRNAEKGTAVAQDIVGCPAVFHQMDLADVAACQAAVTCAQQEFGRLDGVVNAGASTARGGWLDTTPELFDEMMAINLKGPFFLMQAALKQMIATETEGTIVNIASMSGHVGQSFLTPYAISKGAMATMTRNAANAVMRHRIRVNGLNIGWMQSDQEMALHAAQGHGPDWFEARAAELPFGRLLQPEEVARAIAFLSSSQSGMMTGEMVNFDQTIWGANEAPPPITPHTSR